MADTDQNVASWFAANPNATLQDAIAAGSAVGFDPSQSQSYYNQYAPKAQPVGALQQVAAPVAAPTAPAANLLAPTPAPTLTPALAAAPLSSKAVTDLLQWTVKNPDYTNSQLVDAIQTSGGLTPELAKVLAVKYGTTADVINSGYKQLSADNAAIAADNAAKTAAATKYQTNLTAQTDPMKAGIASVLSDNSVSQAEANALTQYMNQTGFKPEDIARVTGVPLDTINQLIGKQNLYAADVIKNNPTNIFGLANYAIDNGLNAKQMAAASNGAFTEQQAKSILDKANTFQGRIELQSPEAYNQIKGLAQKTADENFGGKVQDWQVQMFTPIDPVKAGIPTQLDMTPAKTEVRTGSDDTGTYQYNVETPPQLKSSGVTPVGGGDTESGYTPPTGYRSTQPVVINGAPVYANYDANGKVTGYDAGQMATWLNDKDHLFARWNADGSANPMGTRSAGGGFIKGVGNDVAGFLSDLGPGWTVAKMLNPALALVDVAADVARSKVGVGTGINALSGYAGLQGNISADLTNPSSVNYAGSGIDVGSGVSPALANIQNAQYAKLGAAGLAAGAALDKGNYGPALLLAGNVAGVNQMPGVSTAMNTLSAVNAFTNGDTSALLSSAGNLLNSPNLKLAGAANKLYNASQNPNNIAELAAATSEFGTALKASEPEAVNRLKTAVFGTSTANTSTGSPINQSGTKTTDAGPLSNTGLTTGDGFYNPNISASLTGGAKTSADPGIDVAGPVDSKMVSVSAMTPMLGLEGEKAGKLRSDVDDTGVTTYSRDITGKTADGKEYVYTVTYDPAAKEGKQIYYQIPGEAKPDGTNVITASTTRPTFDTEGKGSGFNPAIDTPVISGVASPIAGAAQVPSIPVVGNISGVTGPSSNIGAVVAGSPGAAGPAGNSTVVAGAAGSGPLGSAPGAVGPGGSGLGGTGFVGSGPGVSGAAVDGAGVAGPGGAGSTPAPAPAPTPAPAPAPAPAPTPTPAPAASPAPTPTKTATAAAPLSAQTINTALQLNSDPQGLTSTVQRNKKILKDLTMLFGSLTPELVSALEDRGIYVPKLPEPKEDKTEDTKEEEPRTEKQIAEDKALETTFAAAGGSIASKIDDKITYAQAGLLPPAQMLEIQSRLGGLKHLHDTIVPRRATVGMAKGGLPSKYAQATPDGHKPEFITGLTGYYASGAGTGQSDDIDAMLHDGDYVADADLVAALGDGSSKAGAEALEKFRRSIPQKEYAEGGQPVAAKIADGEYVFPASFVTAIGKGDNKAGAAILDKMREAIRAHKRSAPTSKIPPKAKSPLDYLKMVKG